MVSPGDLEFKIFVTLSFWTYQHETKMEMWGITMALLFTQISSQFHIDIRKFWQVRNLRLPFHLSVCLFVCNVNDTGRTVQAINTKLGTCMYLGSGYGCIVFGVHDVIDDVIRSKNRSNFEIAITPSIFELECRTKSQKIGNGMAYLGVGLNFRYNFRFKRSPWPQNGGHFENFEIF